MHLFICFFVTDFVRKKKKKKKNRKTLWKKVKLPKMINLTSFHNVFYAICILKSFNNLISVVVCSFFEFETVSKLFITEWVNPFPDKPWSLRFCSTSLLKKTTENEKLLVTSNFSFSHSVFTLLENFLPFLSNLKLLSANSFILEESKICRLGKGLNNRSQLAMNITNSSINRCQGL